MGQTENVQSGGCWGPECWEDLPHQQVLERTSNSAGVCYRPWLEVNKASDILTRSCLV